METAIYYTMSTVAQTLGAAVGLLAVFLVYLLQSYGGPIEKCIEQLDQMSGHFANPDDRRRLTAYRTSRNAEGMIGMFDKVAWSEGELEYVRNPLFLLRLHVALKRRVAARFKRAAVTSGVVVVTAVALMPFSCPLAAKPWAGRSALGLIVVMFAVCILLCFQVVALALPEAPHGKSKNAALS